ncbi:MAG: B12-binding domain-containing radical SAM protein [Clostridia bacterium]|nr:B12-binding domain-containing radical SAM protein [Clostridia bacterium]
MKILLISPSNSDLVHAVSVPLGLVSIGTYLKNADHDVKILDLCVSHQSVKKLLDSFKPDICGISVRSTKQVSFALDISRTIHKKGIPVVWGGPFCNYAPAEHYFDTGVIDVLSFGEGEITWLELADAFENGKSLDNVKGIAFLRDGRIIQTPEREFMDLNRILPSDWSLVDIPKYFQYLYGANKLLYLYLSKGCPGSCTFCYNSIFHRSSHRRKSLSLFFQELKVLVEDYELDGFYLADEMSFFKKSDLYDLCDALDKTGYNLLWGFQSRIGALDKTDFQRAFDSGCRWVDFGIESGSKRMLSIIKKNVPFEKIKQTFDWCEKIGIVSMANFIVGFPGETVDDLRETVNLAKSIPATQPTFFLYGYNYGSQIGKEIYNSGKYKLPKKLKQYSKIDLFYNRLPNFSEIPTWDKKVIQGYFLWQQLTREEYSEESKRFDLFYKHIKTVFNRISYVGLTHIPEAVIKSLFPFARFFFAAKFCKKTLRKYGLE